MGPLFESPPRPLLKSGLQPLGRYGTHQETIGMRHEQIYTLTQDWNGLAWGGVIIRVELKYTLGANTGPLFESPPG